MILKIKLSLQVVAQNSNKYMYVCYSLSIVNEESNQKTHSEITEGTNYSASCLPENWK